MDNPLDNPIWTSLQTIHRQLALVHGAVARYPADHAPFLAVESAGVDAAAGCAVLTRPGEAVYLLGLAPGTVPRGWEMTAFAPLAQMVCEAPLPVVEGPPVIALGEAHRDDVLGLTALVYPHYFREHTMAMGRYFGIYQQGRLAAMIGERLGSGQHREMSAICTHPDFSGRGYARRLTAWLGNDCLARGLQPFLHVSHANLRAMTLYQKMGYRLRRDIGFWALQRRAA